MNSTRRVFTRIGCLIALVVINFTAAFPVSAFASPDKKAWDDSAIVQVKDSLRQISEAATLWQKTGGCSDRECTNASSLAAAGKLAGTIKVPSGIGVANRSPEYTTTLTRTGGCGPASSGAPRTLNPALYFVSEGFCRDYNNSVGLGNTIVENCGSGDACTASGSTKSYEFPTVNSPTFCYRRNDIYAIVWVGTISGTPCPTY